MNSAHRVPRLLAILAWSALVSCTCTEATDQSRTAGYWRPLIGRRITEHDRPLSRDTLVRIAYLFNPRLGPEVYEFSESELKSKFVDTPQIKALWAAQRASWAHWDEWYAMVDTLRAAMPPGYEVSSVTNPGSSAFSLDIAAPRLPGLPMERILAIEVSILVPYYFYYVQHANIVDGLIEREPIRYQVTAELAPLLALAEREIARRYSYWRLDPEVALTPLPGMFVSGHNSDDPPTLLDALFTTTRW
jgi:hypothetical protein